MTCSVDGCERPVAYRGLCNAHYIRMRVHGNVKADERLRGSGIEWIRKNVNFSEDSCLIWPYCVCSDGYGKLKWKARGHLAHRVMCKMAHGEPPTPKHEAAHSCGNGHKACCNPKHLRWATTSENERDKREHGTSNRGQNNMNAKLNESDVLEIIRIREQEGTDLRTISSRFGVTTTTLSCLLNGYSWSWLTGIQRNDNTPNAEEKVA